MLKRATSYPASVLQTSAAIRTSVQRRALGLSAIIAAADRETPSHPLHPHVTDDVITHRQRLNEDALALAREWKRLGRAATVVALLTSPILFTVLNQGAELSIPVALALTVLGVAAFRGLVDIIAHRLVPRPSIHGAEKALADDDVVARRRVWYWRKKYRRALIFGSLAAVAGGIAAAVNGSTFVDGLSTVAEALPAGLAQAPGLLLMFGLLFLINFGILFGPLIFLGAQQIKGYEPGDADWGVKLEDVRGQVEAKEEITKVVALWQSGEEFERAGGKRERGVLFLGAPGTGKTMLSKAIATSFNCPFVTIPGSGFAQTFIGMDAVLVRYLARKAKKLAAKWGGQCIVFIDEIDAVGMRRQALGGSGYQPAWGPKAMHDLCFYGPDGALTPDGDLVIESEPWREKLFRARRPAVEAPRGFMMGGMGGMGGGLALNQLLVVMDGIDDPPMTKRVLTNRVNTFLDALYFVPTKVAGRRLRLKPPRPRKEEIYFIGATNVPIERLDPALVRPGRMGRHVWFRTPTWEDRRDIFDLYLAKVDHDAELDAPQRRDELARITNGYSPAMIDQVCSMALTYAHSDGRERFGWKDLVEAMTVVEAGVAVGQPYAKHEERSIAVHEAGHAVCSHLYNENLLSTRLSIRRRGDSGGHHQAMRIEDRFVSWRSEEVANLIHTLGAMAAELVFYGQNTTGVGGDIASVTARASGMVGFAAMSPALVDLSDRIEDPEERSVAEKRVEERFLRIGNQLMHRSGSGMFDSQPLNAVLSDPEKRKLVAGLIGQAFVVAYNTIRENRDGTEKVADALVERRELFGDEVVGLLDSVGLRKPEIDLLEETAWPAI
jgi:SpoVK/Ycf46/Vps4 family AAA+-type ATPase